MRVVVRQQQGRQAGTYQGNHRIPHYPRTRRSGLGTDSSLVPPSFFHFFLGLWNRLNTVTLPESCAADRAQEGKKKESVAYIYNHLIIGAFDIIHTLAHMYERAEDWETQDCRENRYV